MEKKMKGIVLAGGSGTRLYPLTITQSKQQLPLYDKPMIYYPLSVLMLSGIQDILIISTPRDIEVFKLMFSDGKRFGLNISYAIQPSPEGLAQAFIIGEQFIGHNPCAMVLGDNIFYGNKFTDMLLNARENAMKGKATNFGYQVKEPERFGIMEIDDHQNIISVEEKPEFPKSDFAITGLYFYPDDVVYKAKEVRPSARGELEITTMNDMYLQEKRLIAEIMGGGFTWFDTGTHEDLLKASCMIRTIQENKGIIISCLEQIAYKNGWINRDEMEKNIELHGKSPYSEYLIKTLKKY